MKWSGHIEFNDEEKNRISREIRDMLVKTLCLKLNPVLEEFHTVITMVGLLDEERQRKLLERLEELYGQEKEKNNFS